MTSLHIFRLKYLSLTCTKHSWYTAFAKLVWFVPLDVKWTINFPTVSFREGSLIFVVLKGVSNSSASAFSQRKLNTCFWHWPSTSLFFYVLAVLVAVDQECYLLPGPILHVGMSHRRRGPSLKQSYLHQECISMNSCGIKPKCVLNGGWCFLIHGLQENFKVKSECEHNC